MSLMTQNVSYIDADGNVHHLASPIGTGKGAWVHTDLTAIADPRPPAEVSGLTSWADPSFQHVAYLTGDGQVQELGARFSSTSVPSWGSVDLTRNARAAFTGGGLLAGWENQSWMFVVYQTPDGHLHALSARNEPIQIWVDTDLMEAVPGIPVAALNAPVATWPDLTSWNVVYCDGQQVLHHLDAAIGGGAWTIFDFFPLSPVEVDELALPLTSWWDWSHIHVGFLGDGHIQELAYPVTGDARWTRTDLTLAASGAAVPSGIAPMTSCVDQTDQHLIYATCNDGYLHELFAPIGSQAWKHAPMTAVATGAPLVPTVTNKRGTFAASALTCWADPERRHVVYEAADGTLHQLFASTGSTAWEYAPVTISAPGAPLARPDSPLTSWTQPSVPANLSVTVKPQPVTAEVANFTFSVSDAASGTPVLGALVMVHNGPSGNGPSRLTGANGIAEFLDLYLRPWIISGYHWHISIPPSFTVNAIGFNTFHKEFW